MKLLAFAASLRRASSNKRLIALAARMARDAGTEVDLADFAEFDMPLFNGDVHAEVGVPAGAQEFARRLEDAQGLLISSPEYNFSLPGTLKNAIDWVSRMKPMPLRGKSGMLLSASTALPGGIRGLWQLRIPLEGLGVFLYPDMYTLPQANEAFTADGNLKEEERGERLRKMVQGYLEAGRKLAGAIPSP